MMSRDTAMSRPLATMIPTDSMDDFFLPLSAFDLTAGGKNGCAGFWLKSKLCLFNVRLCF